MDQHILAHLRKVNVVLTSHREFISLHVIVNDQHVRDIRMVLVTFTGFCGESSEFYIFELNVDFGVFFS